MVTRAFRALGTKINLTLFDALSEDVLTTTEAMVIDYEDRFTVNRDLSEVMAINHLAGYSPVKVSADTYELIEKAVQVSQLDLGFNVAIGPLVKLWRIGFTGANRPNDAAIKQCLAIINPANIILNRAERTVWLTQKGMSLDLGGIAKGYIADQIKKMWLAQGVTSGIIDLGGNILLVGKSQHADGIWEIGIQDPSDKRHEIVGTIKTNACSIGTSGIYERKLTIAGRTYHHMFDSTTGFPIQNSLASVTIISPQSVDGEIWSTIAFYQGVVAGKRLIESLPYLDAIFIEKSGKVTKTSGVAGLFYVHD